MDLSGIKYTEEECEALVGKEVNYHYRNIKLVNVIETGIVVNCVVGVGLTIVNKEDKDDNFVCLVGPLAIKDWEAYPDRYKPTHIETFNGTIDMIIEGNVIADTIGFLSSSDELSGEIGDCVFT